jgi:hypothetical protein
MGGIRLGKPVYPFSFNNVIPAQAGIQSFFYSVVRNPLPTKMQHENESEGTGDIT